MITALPIKQPTRLLSILSLLVTAVAYGNLYSGDLSAIAQLLNNRCVECHSGDKPDGGLDLVPQVRSLDAGKSLFADSFSAWEKIHDRVQAGEMPPEKGLAADEKHDFIGKLGPQLLALDLHQVETQGRAVRRRINRFEYENRVRALLRAPWLQLASILPEDGERYRFNKSGEALDVSHVNLARYMQAAEYALREVVANQSTRPETTTVRHYARQQSSLNRRVHFTVFNRSSERATFPLLGYDADLKVLRNPEQPFTIGDRDPAQRELEAFGVVASSYEPIEIRFSQFIAPQAGRYKLRFKGYTFWA